MSAPVSLGELARYRERNSPGPEQVRVTDRLALAAKLPAGARVAAPWRATPLYLFWAPQASYINVLDPMFLAAVDPEAHSVQEAIFDGSEPDVPFAATVLMKFVS